MDELKSRYEKHIAKSNDVKVQYYGGLLNSIASGLKKSRYHVVLGEHFFVVTNRIHKSLTPAAVRGCTPRLISIATREYDLLLVSHPLHP